MKHALPPLDGLKVFEAAARQLSFSKAADELCITKGAVSYQIRRLEQHIDCPLFRRTVRQVYLTDAGQKLFHATRHLFAELNATLVRIKPVTAYDVSIAATTYVAARWLSPRVAKFLEQHPDTSIKFEHSVNADDFKLEEVDLAVVWERCDGNGEPGRVVEMPMPLFPVCSPTQAARILNDPDLLNDTTLLSENRQQDLWLEWFGRDALENPRQIIEDANVRVQAAIDGQGLILADAMMQPELDAGTLVTPFDQLLEGYGYVLKSAPGRVKNDEALAMIAWLCR